MDIREYIRQRITDIRISKNIPETTASVGFGRHPNYLSTINREKKTPSYNTLVDICNYFDITLSEFFANYPDESFNYGTPIQFQIIEDFLRKTTDVKNLEILKSWTDTLTKDDIKMFIDHLAKFQKNKNK